MLSHKLIIGFNSIIKFVFNVLFFSSAVTSLQKLFLNFVFILLKQIIHRKFTADFCIFFFSKKNFIPELLFETMKLLFFAIRWT